MLQTLVTWNVRSPYRLHVIKILTSLIQEKLCSIWKDTLTDTSSQPSYASEQPRQTDGPPRHAIHTHPQVQYGGVSITRNSSPPPGQPVSYITRTCATVILTTVCIYVVIPSCVFHANLNVFASMLKETSLGTRLLG